MHLLYFLCLLLSFSPLIGEELFAPPPKIWKTNCYPCRPLEGPLKEIEENITLDLRNPLYEEGVLSTDEGGVLKAPYFRVQAQKLIYTRHLDCDPPVFTVQCEGNLLIDYRQWTLVGDYLYYDFLTHTGFLTNGKTAQPPWYVGGDEILLLNSGDLVALGSYLTTSEGGKPDIIFRSPQITLTPDKILSAKNLNLWMGKLPLFWFPKLNFDLDNRGRSPFAVKFGWGGFLGSHLTLLYRFLSWGDFQALARLDGFFGHGLGGGIETRYQPKQRSTEAYTRSYYAHDISIDDPQKRDRYRFQGTFYDCLNGLEVNGIYDFVSDAEMAADFNIQDFDLPTTERTQLNLRYQQNSWIANLFTRVRVNNFQSINQELPTFSFNLHPFEIPCTGIMIENTFRAGYLNYVFSDDIDINKMPDFHSARIFTYPRFYRPFFFGPFIATPEVGFIGIGYTNSPEGGSVGQAIGELGFRFNTALSKWIGGIKHVIEPYAHYRYLTQPRVNTDSHYIFTIQDGYDRLNLFRLGVQNSFFVKAPCGIIRPLWIDIWTNAFFNEKTIPRAIPKAYLNIEWQPYNSLKLATNGGWNFRNDEVDYYNGRIDWTINEHIAVGTEYRYRSKYDWRKADFYNFTLETVRTQQQLLASPLSDRRQTFLLRTFVRLTPDWNLKMDLRRGWKRKTQRHYFEYQAELGTIIFDQWKLRFIFEKREADNRFSVSLKLNPGAPPKRRRCL